MCFSSLCRRSMCLLAESDGSSLSLWFWPSLQPSTNSWILQKKAGGQNYIDHGDRQREVPNRERRTEDADDKAADERSNHSAEEARATAHPALAVVHDLWA